jgi:hypothetical protein
MDYFVHVFPCFCCRKVAVVNLDPANDALPYPLLSELKNPPFPMITSLVKLGLAALPAVTIEMCP